MQDEILRGILLDEHEKHYIRKARGFAMASLKRMHAHYDPIINPAEHARVLAALPGVEAVNNKITKLIPNRVWPHVAAAEAAAAAAAANAEAARRDEVEMGIGLPGAAAPSTVFMGWMDEFAASGLVAGGSAGWRFVDPNLSKAVANTIFARAGEWKTNVPSSRSRCDAFQSKIRAAHFDRW